MAKQRFKPLLLWLVLGFILFTTPSLACNPVTMQMGWPFVSLPCSAFASMVSSSSRSHARNLSAHCDEVWDRYLQEYPDIMNAAQRRGDKDLRKFSYDHYRVYGAKEGRHIGDAACAE